MSGQQWGTVIGGVVGAFFGYPQAGAFVGGLIGGAIDPDVIKGPDIGDAKRQHSQAGVPIPKALGMPPPFAGCLIDGDPISRKYTKRERQGKGGGPVQESQGFRATRAILVCEGEVNVVRIWRNNKLVYSRIAGDSLEATTSSFASQLRIYSGSETQLPDPSLEAIHGVGNTPYYRGRCYVVIVDDDETQTGGAANQYLFQVTACEVTARYVEPGCWIADEDEGSAHRVGVPADTDTDSFPVEGTACRGVAMAPNARHVWILTTTGGFAPYGITKLSTVDGSVAGNFELADRPIGICASPDGSFLYVTRKNSLLVKIGTSSGAEVDSTQDFTDGFRNPCISPDGTTLYVTCDGGVKVIDASDLSLITTIGSSEGTTSSIAMSPDGSQVVALKPLSSNFMVIDTSDNSYSLKVNPVIPQDVCFSPDSAYYFLPGSTGNVRKMNASTHTLALGLSVAGSHVACNMNGDRLFVGNDEDIVQDVDVYDLENNVVIDTITGIQPSSSNGMTARPLP